MSLLTSSFFLKTPFMHSQTNLDSAYTQALEWTDPNIYTLPEAGSDEAKAMIKQLEYVFTNYTYENLAKQIPQVYAERIYFRDAFIQLDSSEALTKYMLKGVGAVDAVSFSFNHVMHSKGEYFIEWTMGIQFKGNSGMETSIGMSRFRFNSKGRVIFHQDYWDPTTLIYEKIPIAKQLIRFVQKRM
tara:strand:+ start:904 stop:1461 length:558 start_codon:yes stop_codon:yes gene_type:complete